MNKIFWCKRCVTPSTRPRITFDSAGICNACRWHEEKQHIDWAARMGQLEQLCDQHRSKDGSFDIIIPVSGGKDSTYIAFQVRDKLGMTPLTVTFAHPIPTRLGWQNWQNFIGSGFSNILVSPDPQQYRKYALDAFIEAGLPKQPFVVGISTAIFEIAKRFGVKLILFAENGEAEYGGKSEPIQRFTRDFLVGAYYEGQVDTGVYGPWWRLPTDADMTDLYVTWWSNFQDWDPQDHAVFAKQHAGMQMHVGGNIGTFTNHSQNEDMLQDLHMFLCFVKYGFGRCTSDASIEIRRGRMTREGGVDVVRRLDGAFPVEYLPIYLDYFDMDEETFWRVVNQHANLELLEYTGKVERPYVLREAVNCL